MQSLNKKKYIALVSGGPDSMYMLNKMHKNISIVCHVNYYDREDTLNDKKNVEKICNKYNIKLFILDVKDIDYENIKFNNLQNKYRILRFSFIEKIAKEHNIKNIMVGHNLDDHLELSYMQIYKKSDPFFYGLKKNSFYKHLAMYRPILHLYKNHIIKKCIQKKLNFSFDYSNENLKFTRNKTRNFFNEISVKDKNKFKKTIIRLNKSKSAIHKNTINFYEQWIELKFDTKFYTKICDKNLRLKMIYLYLSNLDINKINYNKIVELDNFIFKGNNLSKFRIDKDFYILKNNLYLETVSN